MFDLDSIPLDPEGWGQAFFDDENEGDDEDEGEDCSSPPPLSHSERPATLG
jgi:hypothetical protein